jgi:short subunit dehydrogenase-like uncharacterized protein
MTGYTGVGGRNSIGGRCAGEVRSVASADTSITASEIAPAPIAFPVNLTAWRSGSPWWAGASGAVGPPTEAGVSERIVLVGAGGAAGQQIARRLAGRGVAVTLAGRDRASLAPLADELGAAIVEADVTRPDPVVAKARMVINTAGPFAAQAGPMAQACLTAGVAYVDIATELRAARSLLALADRARRAGNVLVTGAGFSPAVTESLLLGLLPALSSPPAAVKVAAAPADQATSPGARATFAQAMTEGAAWYADGVLTRAPLPASGFAMLLGEHLWQMLPAPAADLETARQASGAPDIIAYLAIPGQRHAAEGTSYAYAEASDHADTTTARLATLGPALDVTAQIAAETACRILDSHPLVRAGAWTPGTLFGPGLVSTACHITTTTPGAATTPVSA